MEVLVGVGSRRSAGARPGLLRDDAELLLELADERRLRPLARLELAAGGIPTGRRAPLPSGRWAMRTRVVRHRTEGDRPPGPTAGGSSKGALRYCPPVLSEPGLTRKAAKYPQAGPPWRRAQGGGVDGRARQAGNRKRAGFFPPSPRGRLPSRRSSPRRHRAGGDDECGGKRSPRRMSGAQPSTRRATTASTSACAARPPLAARPMPSGPSAGARGRAGREGRGDAEAGGDQGGAGPLTGEPALLQDLPRGGDRQAPRRGPVRIAAVAATSACVKAPRPNSTATMASSSMTSAAAAGQATRAASSSARFCAATKPSASPARCRLAIRGQEDRRGGGGDERPRGSCSQRLGVVELAPYTAPGRERTRPASPASLGSASTFATAT